MPGCSCALRRISCRLNTHGDKHGRYGTVVAAFLVQLCVEIPVDSLAIYCSHRSRIPVPWIVVLTSCLSLSLSAGARGPLAMAL